MKAARILIAALAALTPAAAQLPPQGGAVVPVRVMDLDVVVLDREGHRVLGLKREDFSLHVDRKPVDIDYFAAVSRGVISDADLATLSPDLVVAQNEGDADENAVPRHFLIFLDPRGLSPGQRKKATEFLRDLTASFGPADDGLIVFDERTARILTDWTSSKETLRSALDSFEGPAAEESREEKEREVKRMLSDLTDCLTFLAGKPGKKILLEVSGDFEWKPVAADLRSLTDRANALEVTIFTLDAREVSSPREPANEPPPQFPFARESTQAGLSEMADDTGGRALMRRSERDTLLASLLAELSAYYSIGVSFRNIPPGGPHRIEVAVDRPGLTVRARRTYTVRSEEDRIQDRIAATLFTNTSFADLSLTLKTAPIRRENGEPVLPLELLIPARDLMFRAQDDHGLAEVEYYVALVDDRGERSGSFHSSRTFSVSAAEERSGHLLSFSTSLHLKKGTYRIVANARDPETGRMGTARSTFRVD
jgi:VWFA-related protein